MRTTVPAALPRPRVVVVLLAGRGAYRLAVYAAGLILLAVWGPDEFAAYAGPVGALAWYTVAVSSGPEKAALTLIARPGGAHLHRLMRAIAVTGLAVPLAGWLLLVVAGAGDTAVRYATAATAAGGIGCATVLVALYRLRGAPLVDGAAYLAVAAAYAVAVTLALAGAGATQVLAALAAAGIAVNVALLVGLVRGDRSTPAPPGDTPGPGAGADTAREPATEHLDPAPHGGTARRADSAAGHGDAVASDVPALPRRVALRAAALLGVAELLGTAGASALYAALAALGDAAEISLFYVLAVVTSVVSTGWGYLLRLVQPTVADRYERAGELAGWRSARRTLGATMAFGLPAAVALTAAFTAGAGPDLVYPAIAVEIVLFGANAVSALLLEVSGARGRRWSAQAAVAQFAVVAGAGWLLVPVTGALGGVAALVAGELVRAALLWLAAGRAVRR
ncbi:hypothetical protein AB0K25_20430 [Micromonospora sp. NPDC049257]|uniref:hypothetical protein n=1 Tax=Micromonospora sp. NPDC049257 TaxID=3155771 RepID=UPI00342C720B